jgi:hypothetical protein
MIGVVLVGVMVGGVRELDVERDAETVVYDGPVRARRKSYRKSAHSGYSAEVALGAFR